jgi:hypothetical protein
VTRYRRKLISDLSEILALCNFKANNWQESFGIIYGSRIEHQRVYDACACCCIWIFLRNLRRLSLGSGWKKQVLFAQVTLARIDRRGRARGKPAIQLAVRHFLFRSNPTRWWRVASLVGHTLNNNWERRVTLDPWRYLIRSSSFCGRKSFRKLERKQERPRELPVLLYLIYFLIYFVGL